MSDWIDRHPVSTASIEDDEIVIRIPRTAIPVIAAAAAVRPRSVFVGNIASLREEIVAELNAAGYVRALVGGVIIGLLTRDAARDGAEISGRNLLRLR
jgi:hypothetical protein